MKIYCGADPEIFLQSLEGHLKSAIDTVGGTKENPKPMGIGDGFNIQEDNVAVEFNIPPAGDAAEFTDNIQKALAHIRMEVFAGWGARLSPISAASFPKEELNDRRALEFGCDPDYNAYTGEVNPRPKADDPNLRSCGGHVHIGFDAAAVDLRHVIRMMDLHLGVPSVLMDKGDLRKQLYGKAGAYRQKPYGGEYRTLSNFWIFDPTLCQWVYNNTTRAVHAAASQFDIDEETSQSIVQAINGNDRGLAQKIVNEFNLEVV